MDQSRKKDELISGWKFQKIRPPPRITWDEIYEQHERHNRCDYCNFMLQPKTKVLDHCHLTGYPRATLCRFCNDERNCHGYQACGGHANPKWILRPETFWIKQVFPEMQEIRKKLYTGQLEPIPKDWGARPYVIALFEKRYGVKTKGLQIPYEYDVFDEF